MPQPALLLQPHGPSCIQHQRWERQRPPRRPSAAEAVGWRWGASRSAISRRSSTRYIEDPLCEGNNAGRNCFRIYLIQRIWSDAEGLTQAIDEDIPDGSLLDAITSCSHFNTQSAAAVD